MAIEPSAVLVGEAESSLPSTSTVVASHSSVGAHDQAQMQNQEESEAGSGSGQREAMPATSTTRTSVQPPCPTPSSSLDISPASIQQELQARGSFGSAGHDGVTIPSPNPPSSFFSAVSNLATDTANLNIHSTVAPPTEITPQSPRAAIDCEALLPNTTQTALDSQTIVEHPISSDPTSTDSKQPVDSTIGGAADAEGGSNSSKKDKMIFPNAATNVIQRRRNYATTNAVTDYEADLTNKDRTKQKEAVKRYLAERVKDNWKWERPQSEQQETLQPVPTLESGENETVDVAWKERDEWLSNASGDEDGMKVPMPGTTLSSHDTPTPASKKSPTPIRVESADGPGDTVKNSLSDRKRRRKKRLADEMVWNEGLRCFTARRDAWTCARKVPRRPGTGKNDVTITATRVSVSSGSGDGSSSRAIEPVDDDDEEWEDDTEIPVAPPILPPENAMRASILPNAYNTIYDKVVVQSLTPSCPMNLKDVTRSCVQGWKRDGEWPPKATTPETLKKKARKMSVASLLGFREQDRERDKVNLAAAGNGNGNGHVNGTATGDAAGKDTAELEKHKKHGSGIRRGIQKILNWFNPAALTFQQDSPTQKPPKDGSFWKAPSMPPRGSCGPSVGVDGVAEEYDARYGETSSESEGMGVGF
ncbi:uncharacterized protein RSE6_04157 [Rhynchosporium secalis]|uniref:Gag1-like clamp domain-containing protein n=1 Tax=Rhynchosporium secalis TaxID=38038 RepID=A0A1E1M611_RHYSE|nr:uncharacterized protein RSE6_04157 [Rhynchosporium secalis]